MRYVFVPKNEEECRKAQEVFFANGGKWLSGDTHVKEENTNYLVFYPHFDYFHILEFNMLCVSTQAIKERLLKEPDTQQIYLYDIPRIFSEDGTLRANRNDQNLERDPLDTSRLSIPLRDKLLGRDTHAALMRKHYEREVKDQHSALIQTLDFLRDFKSKMDGPLEYAPQGGDNER